MKQYIVTLSQEEVDVLWIIAGSIVGNQETTLRRVFSGYGTNNSNIRTVFNDIRSNDLSIYGTLSGILDFGD